MKVFSILIGNKMGSFAPSELKSQTLKEMKDILALKGNNENEAELLKIQEEIRSAKIIEGDIKNAKTIALTELL